VVKVEILIFVIRQEPVRAESIVNATPEIPRYGPV
jgi:hypothetical protein